MERRYPILWLTGNSGAGKTTLATNLRRTFLHDEDHQLSGKVVILDGDEMRRSISTEETLTADDRRKHNLRVARLAGVLREQGFLVVVAVIAPFVSVREEIDALCSPLWLHLHREGLGAPDRPYEPPEAPSLFIDTGSLSAEETLAAALAFIEEIIPA